eukprot:TRINITY_DN12897_c0_g1_i2.p1 TRINITY_DN12897_c0_g1~~TRINITY_DN12897_c0_g1_i2.p1  ORF type:complete len:594 (+),score=150.65 TRINITY_DN12897_c0_g1_i2:80-1783(+)
MGRRKGSPRAGRKRRGRGAVRADSGIATPADPLAALQRLAEIEAALTFEHRAAAEAGRLQLLPGMAYPRIRRRERSASVAEDSDEDKQELRVPRLVVTRPADGAPGAQGASPPGSADRFLSAAPGPALSPQPAVPAAPPPVGGAAVAAAGAVRSPAARAAPGRAGAQGPLPDSAGGVLSLHLKPSLEPPELERPPTPPREASKAEFGIDFRVEGESSSCSTGSTRSTSESSAPDDAGGPPAPPTPSWHEMVLEALLASLMAWRTDGWEGGSTSLMLRHAADVLHCSGSFSFGADNAAAGGSAAPAAAGAARPDFRPPPVLRTALVRLLKKRTRAADINLWRRQLGFGGFIQCSPSLRSLWESAGEGHRHRPLPTSPGAPPAALGSQPAVHPPPPGRGAAPLAAPAACVTPSPPLPRPPAAAAAAEDASPLGDLDPTCPAHRALVADCLARLECGGAEQRLSAALLRVDWAQRRSAALAAAAVGQRDRMRRAAEELAEATTGTAPQSHLPPPPPAGAQRGQPPTPQQPAHAAAPAPQPPPAAVRKRAPRRWSARRGTVPRMRDVVFWG